jgi:hypothetical protein
MLRKNTLSTVAFGSIAIACSFAEFALAAGANPLSVKCVRKVEKADIAHFNEKSGRYIAFSQASCNYKEVKGNGLFDGVKSTARGLDNFTGANGSVNGVTFGEKDGDSYRVEWDGRCFGLSGAEGKPINRCFGNWRFIEGSGTGRFSNVRGGGYFQSTLLAPDTMDVEATGFYEQ